MHGRNCVFHSVDETEIFHIPKPRVSPNLSLRNDWKNVEKNNVKQASMYGGQCDCYQTPSKMNIIASNGRGSGSGVDGQ